MLTLADFQQDSFRDGSIEHAVYRHGSGPAVLVLHELPGIDSATFAVATTICEAGFTVVLPDLLPPPVPPSTKVTLRLLAANLRRVCVAREFWALALRYD